MFQVAVCDDDQQQTEIILQLLNKYQADRPGTELCAHSFASGEALLAPMSAGSGFDLFLLDILMPDLDGIELARKIRAINGDAQIAFLTSSADYALDAFRVYAVQYILKPVGKDDLFRVLDKATSTVKRGEDRFFLLKMPKRNIQIPFSSIVCVELASRTLKVYHEDGSVFCSKSIRSKFEEAASPLFTDSRFLCMHKSFILNMTYVEEFTGQSFVMKHGLNVHIPRYRHAEAKQKYFKWISEFGSGIAGGTA